MRLLGCCRVSYRFTGCSGAKKTEDSALMHPKPQTLNVSTAFARELIRRKAVAAPSFNSRKGFSNNGFNNVKSGNNGNNRNICSSDSLAY